MMKPQVGDLIKIIDMRDEPQYRWKTGTVTHIDDAGQLHGTWRRCAIIPETDEFEIIDLIGIGGFGNAKNCK